VALSRQTFKATWGVEKIGGSRIIIDVPREDLQHNGEEWKEGKMVNRPIGPFCMYGQSYSG